MEHKAQPLCETDIFITKEGSTGEEKRTLVSPMEPALQAEQLARASRFYISLLGVSIIYRTPLSHWPYIVLVTYHCVLH